MPRKAKNGVAAVRKNTNRNPNQKAIPVTAAAPVTVNRQRRSAVKRKRSRRKAKKPRNLPKKRRGKMRVKKTEVMEVKRKNRNATNLEVKLKLQSDAVGIKILHHRHRLGRLFLVPPVHHFRKTERYGLFQLLRLMKIGIILSMAVRRELRLQR